MNDETWLKVKKRWFFRRYGGPWYTTLYRQDFGVNHGGVPVPHDAWPLLDRILELEEQVKHE